jgi:hypothetical protein
MRNQITVVQVGYNSFAFPTADAALEFYRLLSNTVPLESNYGALADGRKGIELIRSETVNVTLRQYQTEEIELNQTKEQIKEGVEKRADVDVHATEKAEIRLISSDNEVEHL